MNILVSPCYCVAKHVSPLVVHPPQMYNYFEDAHYVYLVLEMCHNRELCRYLKTTGKRLSEDEVRRLFRQAVQGLLYLHSHNILHRDLTLSNLLLTNTLDAVSDIATDSCFNVCCDAL